MGVGGDCVAHDGVKRVLVTGAAGFLGSHLCDRILATEPGTQLFGLDNLMTGSVDNLAHLARHPRFEFVHHDIVNPIELEVDEIYNLACPASPIRYQADPVRTLRTSVLGALTVLELARAGRARVLQASTSEVYGDPAVSPQAEAYQGNVNTVGPRACYDEGKRAAETLFADYRRQHGVDARIVRIFNTYGPRMQPDDGRVVSTFVMQALTGRPLSIFGDGSQTRSFCYVDDLVRGMMAAMSAPASDGSPINLGNPHEITVAELARMVVEMCGSDSSTIHMPLPQDDPIRRRPDITKAQALLGWMPETSLLDGLSKTIAHFERVSRGASRADAPAETLAPASLVAVASR
jgi:UDP-glucuronate decarboxylase